MRIALFAPYLPFPDRTGGRIRLARLTEGLPGATLFAADRHDRLRAPEVLARHQAAYEGVEVGLNRWGFLPGGAPRRIRRNEVPRLARAFKKLHAERPFDLAVVAHSYAAPLALRSGLPLVVDEHNVESRFFEERAQAEGRASPQSKFRAWEEKVWRAAARVVAVSERDAKEIRSRGGKVQVIPNGVDAATIEFVPPSQRIGANVLFVGLMNHPPNERAAERLVLQVMPEVWASRPDARLVLCGHNPSPQIRSLASERVEVTGSVPSVAPWLGAARVSVNPLEHGAGTSLKVVEALASGTPLVTTSIGVRGYSGGEELWDVADTHADMAKAILRNLNHSDDDRAQVARRFAEAYDWGALAERFHGVVRAVYEEVRA